MSVHSKHKQWLLQLLPTSAILILILGSINFSVDPYGFFRKDFTKQLVEPNQNFLKMRYITNNHTPFDCFLFGSSRVGKIFVQNIHNGGHWYNMTYAGGVPQEHQQNIEYMIKRGVKIKELLIGLDEFSYTIDPQAHTQLWTTKPYSPVIGESETLFYLKYIIRFPDVTVLQRAYREYQIRKSPKRQKESKFFSGYDFYGTGQGTVQEVDDYIERNPVKHCTDPKFLKPYKQNTAEVDLRASALESIRKIAYLSQANGIKLTVFINPIHHVTYMATDHENLFRFKRELSKICNYYDFSGLNAVTLNNYNYYETSHYRPLIGTMIIRRIFAANGGDNSFGELVTAENVERHIAQQRDEIRRHDPHTSPANLSR